MSTKPLLDKKESLVKYCVSDDDVHVETVEKNSAEEEYNDEDVSSESYPASSHYTENTDSVTGGFGLTNRVSYVLCTKDIYIYMSHFSYSCKMRCPLNLVLENWEYLWFY